MREFFQSGKSQEILGQSGKSQGKIRSILEISKYILHGKYNKEARRLYAELKSLAHLISDEIMMSLYGISEIMMS